MNQLLHSRKAQPRSADPRPRSAFHVKAVWRVAKETVQAWSEHRALRLGASLAFYTMFAIAPLFVIVLAIAGFWFGEEAARRQLFDQLSIVIGLKGAEAIQAIVATADDPKAGVWAAA